MRFGFFYVEFRQSDDEIATVFEFAGSWWRKKLTATKILKLSQKTKIKNFKKWFN